MKRYTFVIWFLAVSASGSTDLKQGFPSFQVSGRTAVPIDFQYVVLDLVFDPATSTATGKCEIEFVADQTGNPVLDLKPLVKEVSLNGTSLGAGAMPSISTPDGATKLRMVNSEVKAGTTNRLEVEYTVSSADVSFTSDGARIVWAMNDLSGSYFLERYACANLEFDHFPMSMRVEILGKPAPHQIFSNGSLQIIRNGLWRVEFPDYFTSSSHFFHLTNRPFQLKTDVYKGASKDIPIVVYGGAGAPIDSGMRTAKATLAELESAYGPYLHDSLTVYLTGSSGSGMEHAGATITSLGALEHEITHSWFARGVMPADGNAGWIDESIASWRDNGYPRYNASLSSNPTHLSGFSAYRRHTPQAAYSDGKNLMGRLDSFFPSGMKAALKEVFARANRLTVTTNEFKDLLEDITGRDVDGYFTRYVYNGSVRTLGDSEMMPLRFPIPEHSGSRHPRRFTEDEIRALR